MGEKTDTERGEVEKLALLISGALGRHPCSSSATFHLYSDTANAEGGREGEEEVTKDVFQSRSIQPSNSASSR